MKKTATIVQGAGKAFERAGEACKGPEWDCTGDGRALEGAVRIVKDT